MKKDQIVKGRAYLNASGRSERRVLDIGTHVKVTWFGDDDTEPKGEPGVEYQDTRMGNTFYGKKSGKRPVTMYLSSFAAWARSAVPAGEEAPL